jgi:hypothetical protein
MEGIETITTEQPTILAGRSAAWYATVWSMTGDRQVETWGRDTVGAVVAETALDSDASEIA